MWIERTRNQKITMTYLQFLLDGPNKPYFITNELFNFLLQKCKNTEQNPPIHELTTDYSRRVLLLSRDVETTTILEEPNAGRLEIYKTNFENIFTVAYISYLYRTTTSFKITLPEKLQFIILMAAK